MTWNHRVIKKTYNEEEIFSIEEVMYDTKDHSLQGEELDKTISGYTEKLSVMGDSIEDLRETLNFMLEALDKPVIDLDILEKSE